MAEKKMDNRGSKSNLFYSKFVKEQRVDGSSCIKRLMHLRFTLKGFEIDSQITLLSKQLNVHKSFSTFNSYYTNPQVWSGLIDAEGSFTIIISKSKNRKLGWRIEPQFQVGLAKRDYFVLLKL